MYRVSRLENGLVVATGEMPHMASVSMGIWVGVGGRHEPEPLCGVSHFIEHLLFKGTRKRSARRISQEVEGIGGDLNAYTSEENTCFFSKGCHDRFDTLLDVMMDMVLHSKFDPVEIEKERMVIKEELAMYLDQPQQHVLELLNEITWPDHPLGRSITGTEATVAAMQRADLLSYLKTHYVAGNTLVTVTGRCRHEDVVQAVKKYAPHFAGGTTQPFQPATNAQKAPRLRLFTKQTEQTQFALGVRTCSRHDPRRYALRMLNTILGENMSSRLFQVIREDRGLAYSIGSSLGFFEDTGTLTITSGLDDKNLQPTLKLVMKELRKMTERAPTKSEVQRGCDYLIGQMELSLESTTNQMMWIGEQWLGYGRILPSEKIKDRISAVTPAQVRLAARDFLRPENLCLALVSPIKSNRGLIPILTD
jgi:predicted Zn-dependent peptidase